MKRSEMITIIQECDPQLPKWVAKLILDKIEAAGMRPPPVQFPKTRTTMFIWELEDGQSNDQ